MVLQLFDCRNEADRIVKMMVPFFFMYLLFIGILTMGQQMLSKLGYTVLTAANFDEAVLARRVNFEDFLDRDVNAGFSGGEIKRSELLQLMAQKPDLMLFDEPESGVDMENISLVGNTIAELLEKHIPPSKDRSKMQAKADRSKMGLIITHTGFILDYVSADKGQVLYNGKLSCVSNPREILNCVGDTGYEECVRCISTNNFH